jgi:hypothetical protein
MKRRGRRLAFTAAGMGLAVILGLGILHRGAVRDHLEAWRFQVGRETEMIRVDPRMRVIPMREASISFRFLLLVLAAHSDCPVIFDPDDSDLMIQMDLATRNALRHRARDTVQEQGWHVVEQRIPRRAYVVVRDGLR